MKKGLYILLALAIPLSVLSGCRKFDDDKFSESSSERVQALIDAAYSTLTSSEEGWYFNYYQGWTADAEIGGFWFLCKFGKDYQVEAASELSIGHNENNVYVEDYPVGSTATSDYGLIRGRGAVLTFNTYNQILQTFAEPDVSMPNGYEGDYEFTIVGVTDDVITVKGIKTGKTMYLYRKKDGKTVEQAMTDLEKAAEKVYFANAFNVSVGGAPSSGVASRNNRVLSLTYTVGEEITTVAVPSSTSVDGTGISLYEPIVVNGNAIGGFTLDAAGNSLVSDDAQGSVVLGLPTIPQLLNSAALTLPIDATNMGSALLSTIATAEAADNANGETIVDLTIGRGINAANTAYTGTPALIVRSTDGSGTWGAYFLLNFVPVAGTADQVDLQYTGAGLNAGYYHWFAPIAEAVDGKSPYVLTSDAPNYPSDPTGPTVIKFTSQADPSFFFTAYFN